MQRYMRLTERYYENQLNSANAWANLLQSPNTVLNNVADGVDEAMSLNQEIDRIEKIMNHDVGRFSNYGQIVLAVDMATVSTVSRENVAQLLTNCQIEDGVQYNGGYDDNLLYPRKLIERDK